MTYKRSSVKIPKLSRQAFVWLAEILGTSIRDNETVREMADRMIKEELPGTCKGFKPDVFADAIRQFSEV